MVKTNLNKKEVNKMKKTLLLIMVLMFVSAVSFADQVKVTVELQGKIDFNPNGLDQCITFELLAEGHDPVEVSVNIHFGGIFSPEIGVGIITVPNRNYHCIAARNKLHTLRQVDDSFYWDEISGQYVANFTGENQLIGGNLNDDDVIDLKDYDIFQALMSTLYDSDGDGVVDGNTPCGVFTEHADITGNGRVDLADFSFLQINFGKTSETGCRVEPDRVAEGDDGHSWSSSPCVIATACYETPMAEEVKTLSAFRDEHLLTNGAGRTFVKFYYQHGPKIADYISDKEVIKAVVRKSLRPLVWVADKTTQ